MSPCSYTWTVCQGASFERTLVLLSGGDLVDLSGWTGKAQIRAAHADSAPDVAAEFVVTLGGAAGTILCTLSSTQTQALNLASDRGLAQVELTGPDGKVYRAANVQIVLDRDVVR